MPRTHTDNQIKAIETDGRDICVAAGAGSGKTGVLVERFIRLVTQSREGILSKAQRAGVDEILVITFTEKATKEMKSRIVAELTRLGLTEERRQVETAYISTIHGFCSRLLQENPFEVGVDPNFTVLDDTRARRLLRQTVESRIALAYEANDEETMELVASVQALRRHGEEQADPIASLAESIESVLATLRVAGRRRDEVDAHWMAGPGLTQERSDDVVWSVLSPLRGEIVECAGDLRSIAGSLLGAGRAACDALADCAERIARRGSTTELLGDLREMFQILRKGRTRNIGGASSEMRFIQIAARLKASCESRAPLLDSEFTHREQAATACHRMWRLTAAVWRAYDDEKRRRGVVDNEDLQAECVRMLEDFPNVRERYQRRLRHLLVDEFQDTNPLQMRLIDLLHVTDGRATGEEKSPAHAEARARETPAPNYLFIVGDVQQSIYGFRGADSSLFRALERSYREENRGTHVPLSMNFRSHSEILRLVTHLFSHVWWESETPFVPLEPGAGFDPIPSPCIELMVSQDLMRQDYLSREPGALATRIKEIVEGGEWVISSELDPRRGQPIRYRDIAILLRQLTDIQRYEEAFERAGVPAFVVGGGRGYYARQEIRDLRNILTVLDTPLNDLALLAALRTPMVGVDVDTLYRIVEASTDEHQTYGGVISDAAGIGASPRDPADTGRMSPAAAPDSSGSQPGAALSRSRRAPEPLYIGMQRLLESGSLAEEESAKLRPFVNLMDSLRAMQDRLPVGHLIERLISQTAYDARLLCRPNGRRRLANVRKLVQMANSEPGSSMSEFIARLRDLEKLSDREGDAPTSEEAADVVRIHTMHGAKGLEFPVVILADLSRSLEHSERGLFVCDPHRMAMGTRICGTPDTAYRAVDLERRNADRMEAERLLYVAMTRARERLILCGNLGRNRGMNWGDQIFTALGINESPREAAIQTLIGGIKARVAPLSATFPGSDAVVAVGESLPIGSTIASRLIQAVLNGDSP